MTEPPAAQAPVAAASFDDSVAWQPAGFWRRYLAWSLDFLLLSPLLVLIVLPPLRDAFAAGGRLLSQMQLWMFDRVFSADATIADPLALARDLLADPVQGALVSEQLGKIASSVLQVCLLVGLVSALYFIGFEASRWQATPGKRVLGVRVQSVQGSRLGSPRTALRFFAGSLSWLSLNLGHALAGWRKDGRALHDLLSGARVSSNASMPAWARPLLWAQAGLLLLLLALLLARVAWILGQLATL